MQYVVASLTWVAHTQQHAMFNLLLLGVVLPSVHTSTFVYIYVTMSHCETILYIRRRLHKLIDQSLDIETSSNWNIYIIYR
jgi:hypothetical protein